MKIPVSSRVVLLSLLLWWTGVGWADDRRWENPVFQSEQEAVSAARRNLPRAEPHGSNALRMFVDLTLAEGDVGGRHRSSAVSREMVGDMLITHPTAFIRNDVQRRTIERFRAEVPRQRRVLERRLERFGYPELPGLVYLRLVESVDAFAGLGSASSDRMSQVGGVTYYCRYVVLPLSYVGERSLQELRRSAARNPSLDVEGTVRRWQRESYANLVNTFRHELVHVYTNSTLDVPAYSDRIAFPTWFHEGTATYLAADPHSGLSATYQVYQEAFFFLAQRYGISRLQEFYRGVLEGREVGSVLADVYGIPGSDELFKRASRWHRLRETGKTALWIAAFVVIIAAFRGIDLPVIGTLQLVAAAALLLGVATGLAEHIYGLRGPGVVVAAKIGLVVVALALIVMGVRRVRRHRSRPVDA
jgi:hypothetical protein